jgi:hypothetical protein
MMVGVIYSGVAKFGACGQCQLDVEESSEPQAVTASVAGQRQPVADFLV